MRNHSPRSFTVEVKSGGRDQRTIIPHRAAAPVASRPLVSWPAAAEPQAPAPEPRRILPNLIMPEVSSTSWGLRQSPRSLLPGRSVIGRPRPSRWCVRWPWSRSRSLLSRLPPFLATAPAPAPRQLRAEKETALPLGERWKRRLGRWARSRGLPRPPSRRCAASR